MADKLYAWIDMSDYGFQFALHSMRSTGETLLKAVSPTLSITDKKTKESLTKLGFKKADSGIWYAKMWTDPVTKKIGKNIANFRNAAKIEFPELKACAITLEEIRGENLTYVRRDEFIQNAQKARELRKTQESTQSVEPSIQPVTLLKSIQPAVYTEEEKAIKIAEINSFKETPTPQLLQSIKSTFLESAELSELIAKTQPSLYVELIQQDIAGLRIPLVDDKHELNKKIEDFIVETGENFSTKEVLLISEKFNLATGDKNRPFKLEINRFKDEETRTVFSNLKSLTTYKEGLNNLVVEEVFNFNDVGNPLFNDQSALDSYTGMMAWIVEHHKEYNLRENPASTLVELEKPKTDKDETPKKIKENLVNSQKNNEVGMNHLGQMVYEDNIGRKTQLSDGTYMRLNEATEREDYTPATFLLTRESTEHYEADLRGIAQGIVRYSAEKKLNKRDIINYILKSHKISREAIESSQVYRNLQEKVEHVLLSEMRESTLEPSELYPRMINLLENQANAASRTSTSISLQQYSTPLPLSIVVSQLLNANSFNEGAILEPTIGNGSLVSLLDPQKNIEVVGYDLDPVRISHSRELLSDMSIPPTLIEGDILAQRLPDESFERIVLNPPFGKAPKHTFDDGLVTNRLDYQIASQALRSLKSNGIAVMITGGDGFLPSDSGKIKGGSRYFYNWLADCYAGVKVVELSGDLYRKMGASFPIRLAVVAGKGKSDPVPDMIPVINTHEELWKWQISASQELSAQNTLIQNAEQVLEAKEKETPPLDELKSDATDEVATLNKPDFLNNDAGESFIGHNEGGECVFTNQIKERFIQSEGKREYEELTVIATSYGSYMSPVTMEKRIGILNSTGNNRFLTKDEVNEYKLYGQIVDKVPTQIDGITPPLQEENVDSVQEITEPKINTNALERIEKMQEKAILDEEIKKQEEASQADNPIEAQLDIFDEPISSLGVEEQQEVKEAIEEERASSLAMDNKEVISPVSANEIQVRRALEVIEINPSQARYTPMSKSSESQFLLPINMASAVHSAQADFMEEHGDVDEFVASKLGYKVEELSKHFSAEQIDSVAFSISSAIKGKGFIIGDMTGVGKGRVVAAMIKYSLIQNDRAIFVTEKANLFQDIYRDLKGIGMKDSELNFIITNSEGGQIKDPETDKILYQYNSTASKNLLGGQNWGSGEIILTTYSQINKRANTNKRVADLINLTRKYPTGIILDESHNAAGSGTNTNLNVKTLIELSEFSTFSSATSNKSYKTMALYESCFPKGVINLNSLEDTLASGGAPLLEAVTAILAKDGSLLTRQHDMSKLEFTQMSNEEDKDINIALTNGVAEINTMLGQFSGELNATTEHMNKELKNIAKNMGPEFNGNVVNASQAGITSLSFGSRLANLSRSISLLTNIPMIVNETVKSVREGRKPVIAMQSTMGSLLNEFIDLEQKREDSVRGEVRNPPTLPDLYHSIIEKMQMIEVRSGWGAPKIVPMIDIIVETELNNGRGRGMSGEELLRLEENVRENFALKIADMHSRIDDAIIPIDANPLDYLREELGKRGISTMEISGRDKCLVKNSSGTYDIVERDSKKSRNDSVKGFNDGSIDVAMITGAGMTGLSLHSSIEFKDQRQRHLIIAQAPADPNMFMQMSGRTNRFGQVNVPIVSIANNLMPSETRSLAMLNQKLMNQSAATQSNRENSYKTNSTVDLLNHIGDEVVYQYLKRSPDVVNQLVALGVRLDLSSPETDLAKRITGYLTCFPYEKQIEVYDELASEYNREITMLEQKGISPFTQQVMDVKAKVISSELFYGVEKSHYKSAFEFPVYVQEIEYEKEIKALSSTQVLEMIEEGKARLRNSRLTNNAPDLKAIAEYLAEKKPGLLERSLGLEFTSVKDALESDEPNLTQSMYKRIEYIQKAVLEIKPGSIINYHDHENDKPISAVVTGITMDSTRLHLPSSYTIKFVAPGKAQQAWALSYLQGDNSFSLESIAEMTPNSPMIEAFDSIKPGTYTEKRVTLSGNALKCAELATGKGNGKVTFITMEDGTRELIAIMPVNTSKQSLKMGSTAFDQAEIATKFLFDEDINPAKFISNTVKEDKNATILINLDRNGDARIYVPGTVKNGGFVFQNPVILEAVNGGEFVGNRSKMKATIKRENVPLVIDEIMKTGIVFQTTEPNVRPWLLKEQAKLINEMQKEQKEDMGKTPKPLH